MRAHRPRTKTMHPIDPSRVRRDNRRKKKEEPWEGTTTTHTVTPLALDRSIPIIQIYAQQLHGSSCTLDTPSLRSRAPCKMTDHVHYTLSAQKFSEFICKYNPD